MKKNSRTPNTRSEISAWFTAQIQEWEWRGMPMLGAMLRILRWAYQHGREGNLENLMDTWLWAAEAMERRTLGRAYQEDVTRHPDQLPRSPATVTRHAAKHRDLAAIRTPGQSLTDAHKEQVKKLKVKVRRARSTK